MLRHREFCQNFHFCIILPKFTILPEIKIPTLTSSKQVRTFRVKTSRTKVSKKLELEKKFALTLG